jgi:hypothetical protein
LIVSEFVKAGISPPDELTESKYSEKLHLSVISLSKKGETFNASPLLERFKDTSLGTMSLNQIHISSRERIDLHDGTKVAREKFLPEQEGYYSCDGKVTFDADF